MSTKKIESVLKWVLQGDAHSDAEGAMEELQALREALSRIQNGEESTTAWVLVDEVAKESAS